MPDPILHIAALQARLVAAQDELTRLEYADDFCMTNGSWAAAFRIVRDETPLMAFWRELNDALLNAGQPEATFEEVRVVNGWSVAGAVQHLVEVRS